MSWHEHLSLEIAAEFKRLDGSARIWVLAEELGWVRTLIKRADWITNRKWYRSTTQGRMAHRIRTRAQHRAARAALRGIVAGWSKCSVCGCQYERMALARKERSTCSRSCWSTKSQAAKGQLVEYRGRSQTLTRWAHEFGMSQSLLWLRVKKLGMSLAQALAAPVRRSA